MKNPLSYQSTEYDCGPTTMINAINYLFHRNEISPEVLKYIMLYSLDGYNNKGEAGKKGTTGMAMLFLATWLNQFGKVKKWPIDCENVTGEEVYIGQNSKVTGALQQGGAVVARVKLGNWHYVLLTGIDDEWVYLFDPYYRKNPFKDKNIEMIANEPTKMNRRVRYMALNDEGKGYYALGNTSDRECTILYNRETKKSMNDIEYII